jgi:stage V sporulation protein B
LQEPRAFSAIVAISPAIFFTAITSAFRGYFQGHQEMIPTATSQVIEQVVRVITVLVGAVILLPYGLEFAAGGATFGAVTGGAAASIILVFFYFSPTYGSLSKGRSDNCAPDKTFQIIGRILKIALPLSIGGLVMPLMQAIDAFFVPMRLQDSGLSVARATELFGQLTGMAGSLINLPAIITTSLAVSLVPAVSEAMALKKTWQVERRILASGRLAFLLCLPATAGLGLLATPISILLYDIPEVGIPLRYLSPSVLFLGLYQTTAGALQGLNHASVPVINLTIGLIIKSFLNYILTAIPALNIKGAAIASVVAFFIAFILNYLVLKFKFGIRFNLLRTTTIPLVATGLMLVITKYVYEVLFSAISNSLATLVAIIIGAVVYFFVLLMLGGLSEEDLLVIPGIGRKMATVLKKLTILR